MIDRYHLRYFLSVVDTGNFSRGAAACNVSQPTLSVGIAKLEKTLGRSLFDRSNRRVALTDAGARLVASARAIEAGFAEAERAVAETAPVRTLRLGVLVTTPRRWIERLLADQRSAPGGDRLEIVEGKERDLRERLARGRIDLALTLLRDGDPPEARLKLLGEGYALALGQAHPLAGTPVIRAEQLVNDPMIVRRHCELLPETSRFFTTRGVRPVFAARTTSDDKALSYVRAGLGVTVMPEGFREDGVVLAHLDGFDFSRDIGLVFAAHADAEALRHGWLATSLARAVEPPAPD
ncbi:LysR family transcriptional regulator [Sphingomonas taxi]|uniref:LysR family transcriptional regulator n=1 Tax=Sphingomonas taxi TaxID=1549858 RepID=A0A097EED3_9SPHN|nr:LysR family transcriptional regulator [Sphingomonas taxi]AIT05922.1 LysR family transcriptional regulator [Sphingomonas taxi]